MPPGVDILEVGVPFSDPTADGPVIQRASAAGAGTPATSGAVLEMMPRVRERPSTPSCFQRLQPPVELGPENFYAKAVEAGADGVLVVDLPPEESAEFTDRWPAGDLNLIRLIAPTTPADACRVSPTAHRVPVPGVQDRCDRE